MLNELNTKYNHPRLAHRAYSPPFACARAAQRGTVMILDAEFIPFAGIWRLRRGGEMGARKQGMIALCTSP